MIDDFQIKEKIINTSEKVSAIDAKLAILFDKPSVLDMLADHKKDIEILKQQKSWTAQLVAWLIATIIAIYAAFFK